MKILIDNGHGRATAGKLAAAQEIADGFVKEVPNSKPKGELPTLSADYKSYLVRNFTSVTGRFLYAA